MGRLGSIHKERAIAGWRSKHGSFRSRSVSRSARFWPTKKLRNVLSAKQEIWRLYESNPVAGHLMGL